MSMTLATTWVRRGVAAEFPNKYEVDEKELSRIERLAKLQLADARDDLDAAQRNTADQEEDSEDAEEDAGAPIGIQSGLVKQETAHKEEEEEEEDDDDDDMKEYDLSDYDNDDEINEGTGEKFAMFGNVRSLAYHQPGEEDPYLVLPDEEDSDNEREELQILPTDNLVLAAKVEDEVPHLEVLVYEDDADNIYVHHDVMLPAIPLCLEWIDIPVGTMHPAKTQGNFVAVGMMQPEIEIWNLDTVDSMYPSAILGQPPEEQPDQERSSKNPQKKSKKKKKSKPNDQYHVDAVLTLSLNKQHRNLLASGSADTTIKLWDLQTQTCAKSYKQHRGKVTSIDWHPLPDKSTLLLSGSADDKTIVVTDMRAPDAVAPKWTIEADVERVRWDPHASDFFYVTTEAGTLLYFDSRKAPSTTKDAAPQSLSKPIWTLHAHDGAVSAFDVNPLVAGFLATGSDDRKVKLWKVEDGKPAMVVSRNLEVGRVFSTQFAPDSEVSFRLCVAGSKGHVQVWDTSTNASVRKAFAGRAKLPEGDLKERTIRTDTRDDSESDDDDEEDEGGGQDGWESMDED